ncbi:abortive infection family protein [Arcobacter porcinus]|uniref:Abi_C domain-containing protein n=1 Tax=Arcobacter porcinus TaxID=1935204 RepID=A0A5C2HES6_9BACT|nr:abortive infection family protein [Arcobacter porcinus]OCL90239.1 hypothetical protein AAX27_01644 [Aliarcobacter thereius]QEP41426.1 Abi_C domain-containing protein [Arcobacter porcinus]
MKLNAKTLEKLRKLINEEIEYKSGPKLVSFFYSYISDDIYSQGFPSRWVYTDMKLAEINDTTYMKQCLIDLFSPINFISDYERLEGFITEFNLYLEYDGYEIKINRKNIEIIKLNKTIEIFKKNIIFSEDFIHEQWEKALDRKVKDPEGAITISRTLIESILKYILKEQKISFSESSDLSELYKEVAKLLNLAPEQHQEKIFKQILGGSSAIVNGLGQMRNKLGDSHGTNGLNIKPKERHSELAVNLAGTMAIFLFKTYKEIHVSN